MEQACYDRNGGVSSKKNSKSISSQTSTADSDANGCFECNICFDSAHDPVVTLCGHLYCWPCIFRWLQVQNSSDDYDESDQLQPTCPVCKADLPHTSLVPLYGRGARSPDPELKKNQWDIGIPGRPRLHRINSTGASPSQRYVPQLYAGYAVTRSPYLRASALSSFSYPIIDMLKEMVFARTFGSSESNSLAHRYVGYYPHNVASDSNRMRRQEILMDKSLSRVSLFLLCCVILCLLLF